MAIQSFLDLDVYKESFQLSIEIDDLLKGFPPEEKFLLVDQMKRASRSIPSLIAEGYAKRESQKEFKKFLRDALAEANEMMNHLAFAKSRKYIDFAKANNLINRYAILGKKLHNLREKWINFK